MTSHADPQLLDDLGFLVGCDTRNPPRSATGFVALFDFVERALAPAGFVAARRDLGDGCLWLHARRGQGGTLVNIHVDTVPDAPGWPHDPHQLGVTAERATGLGACDTKGALAAYLAAARATVGAAELLLTTDEEAGQSRCVRTFTSEHPVLGRLVVVAEPTRMQAVVAHRGIATCAGLFTGVAGHASQARALDDSAVHEAVRWGARALEHARAHDVRFNLGLLEGGQKANMIAGEARVRFGVRPAPGMRSSDVVDALCALAPTPARVTWTPGYVAPSLLCEPARADAERLGLRIGPPVDFFTEAALFAEAGARAFVVGPGDIADAHTAHESVTLDDVMKARAFYARLLGGERS